MWSSILSAVPAARVSSGCFGSYLAGSVMICTAAFVAATGSLGVAVCRRPGPAAQSDAFDGGRHDLFVAVCVRDGDGGLAGPCVAGVRLQLSAGDRKSVV